jgi:hypothetical protein
MKVANVIVTVETIAGSSPEDAIWDLHDVATRLNCKVRADVNDIDVLVHPKQSVQSIIDDWRLRYNSQAVRPESIFVDKDPDSVPVIARPQ